MKMITTRLNRRARAQTTTSVYPVLCKSKASYPRPLKRGQKSSSNKTASTRSKSIKPQLGRQIWTTSPSTLTLRGWGATWTLCHTRPRVHLFWQAVMASRGRLHQIKWSRYETKTLMKGDHNTSPTTPILSTTRTPDRSISTKTIPNQSSSSTRAKIILTKREQFFRKHSRALRTCKLRVPRRRSIARFRRRKVISHLYCRQRKS